MSYATPLIVWALCFIVPEHFPPWTAYHTEAPAFLAAVLALVVCWRNAEGQVAITRIFLPVLLLIFTIIFQFVMGRVNYVGDTLVATAYLLLFVAACWWGNLWAEKSGLDALMVPLSFFLVLAGLLVSFQMLAQWLEIEGSFGGWIIDRAGRPYSNLGQPNQAGTLLVMASVSAMQLRQQKKLSSSTTWLLLAWLAWCVVLTQSRTALLSSLVVVVFIWTVPKKIDTHYKQDTMTWLLIVFGMAGLFHGFDWFRAESGFESNTKNMLEVAGRKELWTQLILALADKPWLGWGWLQIPAAHQFGALQIAGTGHTDYAHNAVLDLFLMVGVPIGLLLILWTTMTALRITKGMRFKPVGMGLICILIPFLVHSTLEFPHAYAYFILPLGLILGAIERDDRTSKNQINAGMVPRLLLGGFAALLMIFYVCIAFEYAKIEEDYRVNRYENGRLGTTPADYQPPKPILLTQFGELLAAMRLRPSVGMSESDLAILRRVSNRFTWAPIQFRAALSMAMNEQFLDAHHQLKVIKVMFPPEVYLQAKVTWMELASDQYPQLAKVELP